METVILAFMRSFIFLNINAFFTVFIGLILEKKTLCEVAFFGLY